MLVSYIASFIKILFGLLNFVIIARVLLSWFPGGGAPAIRSMIHEISEPVLAPFRRIIPHVGMIDISPIVALFALGFLQDILLYLLSGLPL